MKKLFLVIILIVFAANGYSQKLEYPVVKKVDHVDEYFGTKVEDPYRWMEDDNTEEIKDWVKRENEVTFSYLDKISFRDKIRTRLSEIWNYPKYTAPFKVGDYYMFYKNDGMQNQSVLYIQKGINGTPEVFLDPNTFSAEGTSSISHAQMFYSTGSKNSQP